MEDYPSLAEGNGLENRQVGQTTQEFESLILLFIIAGWSSLVARRAHNPKVVGSNPAPATNLNSKCTSLNRESRSVLFYLIKSPSSYLFFIG